MIRKERMYLWKYAYKMILKIKIEEKIRHECINTIVVDKETCHPMVTIINLIMIMLFFTY